MSARSNVSGKNGTSRYAFGRAAGEKRDYPVPFSLRLTFEERAALEQAAADMPLGAYIRSRILGEDARPRKTRNTRPVEDHQALGQVLGELGRSRIANNLNQLAHAANSGSLPVTPDTEAAMMEACREVQALRAEEMRALGLRSKIEL